MDLCPCINWLHPYIADVRYWTQNLRFSWEFSVNVRPGSDAFATGLLQREADDKNFVGLEMPGADLPDFVRNTNSGCDGFFSEKPSTVPGVGFWQSKVPKAAMHKSL